MSSLRRVVGARTGRSIGNITISSRISSLFNGGISLVNSNAILYKNLSEESRKNPETLKLAIEEYSPDLPNPFEYALKEAITDENIKLGIEKGLLNVVKLTDDSTTKIKKLKYYIAGSTAYMYDSLLLNTDKDIVKYIILLGNTSVYKYLSEDLRKDSEILRLVIEKYKRSSESPLVYALKEALTYENICFAIEKRVISFKLLVEKIQELNLPEKELIIKFMEDVVAINVYADLPANLKKDKDIVKYIIIHGDAFIYKDLPEELRKDPEILRLAIEYYEGGDNPIIYALKEALTQENIRFAIIEDFVEVELISIEMIDNQNLMYFVVGKKAFGYDNRLGLTEEKDIVKYIIENGHAYIYKSLSEELRKNSEVLKSAIMNWKERYSTPSEYALPEALTNEIIDLLISHNIFPETDNFLGNKYYILQVAEKKPNILYKVTEELKNDKEIQLLSLIFHPKFLEFVECESIQQFLSNYGSKHTMVNYGVKDVLKDSDFIKNILLEVPQVYALLPDEWQRDKENIRIILESDGTNLIFVPYSYATDDILSLAKNFYSELFELLDDSSRILDFIEMIKYYDKMFAYVLYIFIKDSSILHRFINSIKNNEKAAKEMVKVIGNSKQLFADFLNDISSNSEAMQFFGDFLKDNNVLIPKRISDNNNLWSPIDRSFRKVYKFVRAVIGIAKSGEIIEISLDYNGRNHNEATAEIGIKTGCIVENPYDNPFFIGKEVSRQGTLIIQIEGSSMTTFLPEGLSLEQYNSLMKILELCKEMKTIGFTHKPDDLYADDPDLKIKITLDDLVNYCNKILKNQPELGKQNTQ